jgi:ABC-2 type transport system permease protein
VFAAVRVLRGEEDAGRQELVLTGALSRRTAYVAALAAVGLAAGVLWLALMAAFVAAHLHAGASAYLALATVSPALPFLGVGALASQLAPNRRVALQLALSIVGTGYLIRVVADLSAGLGFLRWATPLGWSEELRPFASSQPVVLLLPAAFGLLLLGVAGAIATRRDSGRGVLHSTDTAAPRLGLLGSPTALALRSQRGSLIGWVVGIGVFALVIGILSTSFTSANVSASLRKQLHKIGGSSFTTPAGVLGFYFLLFVFAISLYACSQIAAIRREEADQQLETLFALPVRRDRWLLGRLLLAAAGSALLAVTAALFAWAGAASQHAHVGLPRLLEAGANCLPAALLFLALSSLGFALLPRASSGIAYGLVSVAFVWQLIGGIVGAPHWLLDVTPFQHVGLVPSQAFRATGAVTMLVVAAAVALASIWSFRRRDLIGA